MKEDRLFKIEIFEIKTSRHFKAKFSAYSPFPSRNFSTYSSQVQGTGCRLFIKSKW